MKAEARRIMRSPQEEIERLISERALEQHGWNSDKVLNSLVDAFRTLRKLPDRTRHKTIRSVWPDDTFAKEPDLLETERFAAEVHAIALGQDEIQARQSQRNRTIIPPSPLDIDRMTLALVWPARYIEDRALRVVVMECAVVHAADRSLRKMCRERGWPYTTTFARCQRAGAIMAKSLNQDKVAAW